MIPHILVFPILWLRPSRSWGTPKSNFVCQFRAGSSVPPPEAKLQNRKNKLCAESSQLSFQTGPVKNIENWRSLSILSVDIFEKKYFLNFGKSPILTPDFQNFIFWIKKYYPKDHYKTLVSGFGPAGCMWHWSELKIGEKWESHGSPPTL